MTSGSEDRERFLASAARQIADMYGHLDRTSASIDAAVDEAVARVRRLWDRFATGPPPFPNLPRQAPLSDDEVDALTSRILERLPDPQ